MAVEAQNPQRYYCRIVSELIQPPSCQFPAVNRDPTQPSKQPTVLLETGSSLRSPAGGVVSELDSSHSLTVRQVDHEYRMLIETMNEGALTLTAGKHIIYANQGFARMVKCPLDQILDVPFHRFLSVADRMALEQIFKRASRVGTKIRLSLKAGDGSQVPVQISIRLLERRYTTDSTIAMVVTDITEARRAEELLRALTHRVVQAQEAERGRVALELHDKITQHLCASLVRCQTLVEKLSSGDGASLHETMKLCAMLGQTAEEAERISRDLRPSVLDELGLVPVVQDLSAKFSERTGVTLKLTCIPSSLRLPSDTELTLYRILQEALNNVERHAHASHVAVHLSQRGTFIRLAVIDDGVGFDPRLYRCQQIAKSGLGLLSMRERATYLGGNLKINSVRRAGTIVEVRIPLSIHALTAN